MDAKLLDLSLFSRDNAWFLEEVGRLVRIGFWIWDLVEHRTSWTSEIERVCGLGGSFSRKDLPAVFAPILHPDDRQATELFFQNLEQTCQGDHTFRIVWPDGTFKVVRLISGLSQTCEDDRPVRLSGVLQDLTTIQASENYWRYALEGAGDGVWDWEIASGKANFSDTWKAILGYQPAEIADSIKEWETRVHPDDLHQVVTDLNDCFSGRNAEYRNRHRLRCQDGSWKWVLDRGKVMAWSADGRPQRMIGTLTDIQDSKLLEERLVLRELDYDRLLRAFPGVIYRYDLVKMGIFYAGQVESILGYDARYLLDHPEHWKNSIHPDDRTTIDAALADFKKGLAFDIEYRVQHRDGTWRWVNDRSLEPQPGSQANVIEGVAVDITEKVHLAEVSHRSQRLESLSVLSAGIAHDFNNLLAGIFGFLQLAQLNTADGSKAAGYLDKSISIISRAQGLTQQLMTFSKGGAPKKAVLNVERTLRENISFALSGSKVDFQIRIPEELWLCEADEHQLGQVFDNLAINAVQAMPDGGRLTITAVNQLENDRRWLKITFSDTGCGIPAELLPKIFDPFFTTKKTGHGLGLATCHSIIQRHDGNLLVSSEVGVGTTFTLTLPALVGRMKEDARPGAHLHSGKGKILVLDDQIFLLEVIRDLLASLGYSAEICSSESQLMDVFRGALQRGEVFEAILLDLTIPGGTGGLKVGQELKALDAGVKLVAVSGYSNDPVMANPLAYGFVAGLSKPFTMKGLHELFNTILPNQLQNRPD